MSESRAGGPLDLEMIEARLAPPFNYDASDVRALIAECRALRTALRRPTEAQMTAAYYALTGAMLKAGVLRPEHDGDSEAVDKALRAAFAAAGWLPVPAPAPEGPSPEAIAAYWRAWSLTPLDGDQRDSQESHLAGLRAAYAVDRMGR